MDSHKDTIKNIANFMSKYIRIHVYICLIPFLEYVVGIDIILWLVWFFELVNYLSAPFSFLFIPALFWFVLTLIFKEMHAIMIILGFTIFILLELLFIFAFWG